MMERIKKTITIPKDLVEWAKKEIKEGKYPGVRSLSGFIEYLLCEKKKIGEIFVGNVSE